MRQKSVFDKPFKKGDIIVYVLLAVLVFGLFMLALNQNTDGFSGFEVIVDGHAVFVFSFEHNDAEIFEGFANSVERVAENRYKFITETGYNIIEIDFVNQAVKVVEADCGYSKECMHMHSGRGVIICAPHKLVLIMNQMKDEGVRIG